MKHFFTITLIILSISFAAQADEAEYQNYLPRIGKAIIEVVPAPQYAAVQPTAYVVFEFASCSKFSLFAKLEDYGATKVINILIPKNQRDCKAMPITRTYKLQISSDYKGESYIVRNPLAIQYRANEDR